MDSFNNNSEFTDWPTKPGEYWFYGYRYGKNYYDREEKKGLMLCRVFETQNGVMHVADGQIIYKSEVEEAAFIPATMPELPIANE
jgi:hypothetical protein